MEERERERERERELKECVLWTSLDDDNDKIVTFDENDLNTMATFVRNGFIYIYIYIYIYWRVKTRIHMHPHPYIHTYLQPDINEIFTAFCLLFAVFSIMSVFLSHFRFSISFHLFNCLTNVVINFKKP